MSKLFEEPLTLYSSEAYTINLLNSEHKKVSKSSNSSEIQASVFEWFQRKGIVPGNPEGAIKVVQTELKVQMK